MAALNVNTPGFGHRTVPTMLGTPVATAPNEGRHSNGRTKDSGTYRGKHRA